MRTKHALDSKPPIPGQKMLQTSPLAFDNTTIEVFMLDTPPRVAGRTLGFALLFAPSDRGQQCVAREINALNDDGESLAGLAHLYIFGFIRIFRNSKGPTPAISADQSADPLLHQRTAAYPTSLRETRQQPELKAKLLHRDYYRCALTGRLDYHSLERAYENPESNPDLQPLIESEAQGAALLDSRLQVAHIISQSLTDGIGGLSARAKLKLDWASSTAAILDRFSGTDVKKILGGFNLHTEVNAFMAAPEPHQRFDCLDFCLLPAKNAQNEIEPTIYDTLYLSRRREREIKQRVEFTQRLLPNGQTVQPPSPALLALHAACARIAHMSGAGDILDEFDREIPPTAVLTTDCWDMQANPAAAQDLSRALYHLAIVQHAPVVSAL